MLKTIGIIGVLLSIAIVLSVAYGCASKRESDYWGQISKQVK